MSEPVRTAESIAEKFPDAGPAPSNEVVVDPAAEPAPNTGHPR
ncbi:MAG TPA: hypothetical protein VFG35_18955 [Actinoplanes sp.]|nr:hypothetical protein [Actinoplanes sp.]